VFTRIDDHPRGCARCWRTKRLAPRRASCWTSWPRCSRRCERAALVVEEVLRAPADLQTVQQVAARARVDRRTFERWFARLGLPSPRHFLAAARVLYAHRLLQDPGFTVEDVAQRLGYAQTKTLQLHAAPTSASPPGRCGSPSSPARRSSASLRDSPAAPGPSVGVMSGTPHPPASPPPPSTILIVEDEAALRRVLERVLRPRRLSRAGRRLGRDRVRAARLRARDAVLLDVQLPTMSGLALYLALVHRHPTLAGRIAIMSVTPKRSMCGPGSSTTLHRPQETVRRPSDRGMGA